MTTALMSPSKPPATRQQRGFTMMELMVTVSVIAIMAAIAAPNLSDFLAEQRIRAAASDLAGDLSYARTQAMSLDRRVTIEPITAGNWGGGWRIWANNDGDVGNVFDADDLVLKSNTGLSGAVKTCSDVADFAGSIAFRSDGRVRRGGGAVEADSIILSDSSSSVPRVRRVFLSLTGRVSVMRGLATEACV